MTTILFAFVILSLLICYKLCKRKYNFPPGPTGLPIIGTIQITHDVLHLASLKLVKTYGPIVGIKLASEWVVVLHGAKLIRESFNKWAMSGRSKLEANCFIMGDEDGIIQASGDIWLEQRRFALRTLRDFGFGKTSIEQMILDEGQELCQWLNTQSSKPVELDRRFKLIVVNSLWRILTGERYKHDDVGILEIIDKVESTETKLLESPLKAALYYMYPNVAKYFSNVSGWKSLEETVKSKNDLFDQIIREHAETRSDHPRDFIDAYLEEVAHTNDPSSSFHSNSGAHSLRSVISDFFMAGADTASVTLDWTILYLLHNPHVQKKMQEELDSVLGCGGTLRLNDRQGLPYIECVVMEVLRHSSIAPTGVAHLCVEDVKIGGYDICKGTVVFPNFYESHHDPEVWGDPETFRPDRFMIAGACMHRHDSFMPFSVGRRACMGENLAKDTLFLLTALMLYNFTIEVADGESLPTLEPRLGKFFLEPQKFHVSMKPRSPAA